MVVRWMMFMFLGLMLIVAAPSNSSARALLPYCLMEPDLVTAVLPARSMVPRFRYPLGNPCGPNERSVLVSGTALSSDGDRWGQSVKLATFANHLIAIAAFFASAYFLGRCVQSRGWNANETRKLLGAIMLLTPWLIGFGLEYVPNRVMVVLGYGAFLVSLALFWEPVRRRSQILQTAFAAIDRPEDRPHTLTWLTTSYVACSLATLLMAWWVLDQHRALAFTVMFSVIIGDLLAGAVGYRFGHRRFETAALFTNKRYTRSLEGSACVFLVTLAILWSVSSMLPLSQFVAAALVLPLGLTLAEAKSPHTWDEPIMTVVGTVLCLAIVTVLPA